MINRISSLKHLHASDVHQKVISFDLFDTLIYRRYLQFNQVHDLASGYALALLGRSGQEKPGDLTLARYGVTDSLKRAPAHPVEEPALQLVWSRLISARIGPGPAADAMAQKVANFEYEVDRLNLHLVDGATELLSALKAAGKRVVATSDMYFSGDQIRRLLEGLGVLEFFDCVFVSADEGCTKQTGRLFTRVGERLGVAFSDIVHLGDNIASDVEMPRALGISSVHVDQHVHLQVDNLNFGRRSNIHLEISDLIKIFIARIQIDSLNEQSEKIYFLSRDGRLVHDVMKRWSSSLIADYWSAAPAEDLFISRAISCWLNVNFQGQWLLQSIGHAFWLHHGDATPRQISTILGIDAVPPDLPDRSYNHAVDTFTVLEAYERAGLTESIRASLFDKRSRAMRYLDDSGFLKCQRVAICDIGYSGTVPRDLNTFFMQEAAEEPNRRIPQIVFHSIASNGNYASNAIAALPHVRFLDRVILPIEEMPGPLAESFAWLEMFFKHPTWGPLLGYRESQGKMVPDYEEADRVEEGHPAAKILAASDERPSDIILLWMAVVGHWQDFARPLMARFADPDDATIEQMLSDIYEVDAVSGNTRSIVLLAPELTDDELRAQAKARDYWIPGSLAASRRYREAKAAQISGSEASAISLIQPQGGLLKALQRLIESRKVGPFDPNFYREFYPDLRSLIAPDMLMEHYRQHGRLVGRYGSEKEFRLQTASDYGALPVDFDYGEYLWVNRDLVPFDPARWHAELHYLRNGRSEGRAYRKHMPILDRDFDKLIGLGKLVLSAAEKEDWNAGVPTRTILFRRHGVSAGPWLDALDLTEFVALNFSWCGPLDTRAEAVLVFLEQGLLRLAPLSLTTMFDPLFYREQYGELVHLDDVGTYRHWLSTGALRGHAPSEGARLDALIGEPVFPVSFKIDGFQRRNAVRLAGWRTRCDLLEAFLDWGDPTVDDDLDGEGSTRVWSVLARRAAAAGDRVRARAAYHRALADGVSEGRLWHRLGDLYSEDGRHAEAVEAYHRSADSAEPDRWSFIKGALSAAEIGAFETGLRFIERGEFIWRQMEPWRRARAHLLQRWFDEGFLIASKQWASDLKDRTNRPHAARTQAFVRNFADNCARTLPSNLRLARPSGHVMMLTRHVLTRQARSSIDGQISALWGGRIDLRVFSREDVVHFGESLMGASLAIIHEVEIDSFVIEAILLARAYGVPSLFWTGPLGPVPIPAGAAETSIDLSDLMISSFMADSSDAEPGLTFRSLQAAALCDQCITSAPSLVPILRYLSKASKVSLVRTSGLEAGIALCDLKSMPTRILIILGSMCDRPLRMEILKEVAALLASNPDIEVILFGDEDRHSALLPFLSRITMVPEFADVDQRVALVAAVDLVVDLTSEEPVFLSWWADAAFCGVATIAVVGARAQGADAASAILVAHPMDAFPAIREALASATMRERVVAIAKARLHEMISPVHGLALAGTPSSASPKKTRILFVNIFAPPQITGGATRVLSDNIETLLDNESDRYDVAILASDDDNSAVGAVRCDEWRGTPVFRISTPQEVDMDWRTYNGQVDGFARRVLSLVEPDIVHIHCLTRLGVGVAEACQALGRPYIVTLHDAWWLSDFAFLVDEEGRAASAEADPLAQSWSERIGLPRSLGRAARVRAALAGAKKLLAVSDPFAEIYRHAGFNVETIANGVSELQPQPKTPGRGRIRLGHIGGMQHHKGAFLVEAVLRTNHFSNLELMIVDLARDTNDITHTMWGSTPVMIVGKTRSDKVAALYGNLDILLAPSIWPESFGLVSREALASGLWVVATDQGAMGESVQPGVNGFVINVETPEGLKDALRIIDADPTRYMSPPASLPKMRTAQEQGLELIALYDRFLGAASDTDEHINLGAPVS